MTNTAGITVLNEWSDKNETQSSWGSQFPWFQDRVGEQSRKRARAREGKSIHSHEHAMRRLYIDTSAAMRDGKDCKNAMRLTLAYEVPGPDDTEYSRDQIRRAFMQMWESEFPKIYREKEILPLLTDMKSFNRPIIHKPLWLSENTWYTKFLPENINDNLDFLVNDLGVMIESLEEQIVTEISLLEGPISSQDDIKLLYALRHLLEIATKKKEQVDSKDEAVKLTDQLKD